MRALPALLRMTVVSTAAAQEPVRLAGKVVDGIKGTTTLHVTIEVAGGATVTAAITNDAVDELKLTAGDKAYAVIKASDVMVGKD